MLDIYKYYARCNQKINADKLAIIRASDKAPYDRPVDGYYKSIGEILDHYFIADTVWLKAFRQVRDSGVYEHPLLTADRKWGERQFVELDGLAAARAELDGLILRYVGEIRDEDLEKRIERYTRAGAKQVSV